MDYDLMDSAVNEQYIQLVFAQLCEDILCKKYIFHPNTMVKKMTIPFLMINEGNVPSIDKIRFFDLLALPTDFIFVDFEFG